MAVSKRTRYEVLKRDKKVTQMQEAAKEILAAEEAGD